MGKIIEFRRKTNYYKNASQLDRWYIRQTVAMNLKMENYKEVEVRLGKKKTEEITECCAEWYLTKEKEASDRYIRAMIKVKVGAI